MRAGCHALSCCKATVAIATRNGSATPPASNRRAPLRYRGALATGNSQLLPASRPIQCSSIGSPFVRHCGATHSHANPIGPSNHLCPTLTTKSGCQRCRSGGNTPRLWLRSSTRAAPRACTAALMRSRSSIRPSSQYACGKLAIRSAGVSAMVCSTASVKLPPAVVGTDTRCAPVSAQRRCQINRLEGNCPSSTSTASPACTGRLHAAVARPCAAEGTMATASASPSNNAAASPRTCSICCNQVSNGNRHGAAIASTA